MALKKLNINSIMKFIDLHTHVAYNLDDGLKTKEETLNAFIQANKQGYESIVMTPHINMNSSKEYYQVIKDRYNELKEEALEYGLGLYLGSEIKLDDGTLDLFNQSFIYTINESRYILIECDCTLPYHYIFDKLEDYLNVFLNKGYRPVIAHIERYFKDDIDLDYIEYLIQKGCLIQINTNSLLDKKNYKKVQSLLDQHLVHLVCSDAHSLYNHRTLNMSEAYHVLKNKRYDNQYIEDIMYNHAYMIIHNKDIEIKKYKKRNILCKVLNV